MFQPSQAPETDPIERVWQHLKFGLRWQLPKNFDELAYEEGDDELSIPSEFIVSAYL